MLHPVRDGGFKYILSDRDTDELYDLEADPGERTNRIATLPDEAARLRALLAEHLRAMPAAGSTEALSDEETLRALGHVE